MNKITAFFSYCDAATEWQFGIQDPATPTAEGMIFFHNYIMFYVIAIGLFVYWMLYAALQTNSKIPSKLHFFAFSTIIFLKFSRSPSKETRISKHLDFVMVICPFLHLAARRSRLLTLC